MGLISDLHPLNLEEEKHKFFQSNSYNPQFKYRRSFSQKELTKYGLPTAEFEKYIRKMIARYQPIHFPVYPEMLAQTFSNAVNKLCLELQIPDLPISFSANQTARIMLTKKGLGVRTPIFLDDQALEGLLNHEIQTHYLRRLNHQYLPVDIAKAQDPIQVKYTEEGLALLHTYLPNPQPFVKQFVASYAEILSQKLSFREVYSRLLKLGLSSEISFKLTLKQKRGLTDTSKPGGFAKSHIYLEGANLICKKLLSNSCLVSDLYFGKVSVLYVAQNHKFTFKNYDKTKFPLFTRDIDNYLNSLTKLHQINFADS